MEKLRKISFVIPCYNTTSAIHHVLDEITSSMEKLKDYTYEIILVNDASPNPNTITNLQEVIEIRKEKIFLIDLAKNVGQPGAILAGLRFGSGDLFMTADDDGQTPMNQVDKFIEGIDAGRDVMFAAYTARPKTSCFRQVGSYMNRKMSNILIPRPEGIQMTTIFMAKKYVVDEIIKYDQPFAYMSGLVLRVTHNIGNVEIEQRQRESGASGYTLGKLLRLWVNGATAFSIVPLRIAAAVGMIVALLGFILLIGTIVAKLILIDFQAGWTSVISVILLLSGFNLLLLGVMGEYIGRIYLSVNKTPQSVVRTVYFRKNEKEEEKCDEL